MPEEFWIAIEQPADVVNRGGDAVVGRLEAGATCRATGSDEHWFAVQLADGTTGFVARSDARIVAGPPPAPAPSPPPPPKPAAPISSAVQAGSSPVTPPGQPPAQPPAAPPVGEGGSKGRGWIIALLAAVVVAGVAVTAYSFLRSDTLVLSEGEVFLEAANDPGPGAFTTTITVPDAPEIVTAAPVLATVTTTVTTSATAPTSSTGAVGSTSTVETMDSTGRASLPAVSGAEPGLYGGTQDASRCDPDQMVVFLNDNPDKAQAWIQGINADPGFRWSRGTSLSVSGMAAFMAELTPVTLVADTRVTNNGYRDGSPTPRQSVLQAGTSVLVDTFGVPRVKCNCGNPLAPPEAQAASVTYTGKRWDEFQPVTTVAVQPSLEPMPDITLVDIHTGELIERPVGTTGTSDVPTGVIVSDPLVAPATATTSTAIVAAPTTTALVPTTLVPITTETAAPSVLISRDFCTAYSEYAEIDDQYSNRYEDPESVPEYNAFVIAALTDLARIAPASVKADWEYWRDAYASNPGEVSDDPLVYPGLDESIVRMLEHLETACGIGIFDASE